MTDRVMHILPVVLAAALCLCSAGCGQMSSVETPAKKQVTVWTWDETFNVKAAKLAEKEYERAHPDVDIVVETREREDIYSSVQRMLAAKLYSNLPDVIMMEDYDVQPVLANYGDEFVDLTKLLDADRFTDFKAELASRGGWMFGIPFDSGAAALFYRKDILERAGYSEEDMQDLTWQEYIDIAKDVYEKTGTYMLTLDPTDLPVVRIIMQSCGRWYVKENGETPDIRTNYALKKGLEVYQDLLENGSALPVNGWNEFVSGFQTGEVASVVTGGWIISSLKVNQNQKGLWRVARIPTADGVYGATSASSVGGSAWYVLKNGGQAATATDFAVSMFGKNDDLMDDLIEEIGLIPAVKDPSGYSNYEAEDPFFGGQKVTKFLWQVSNEVPVVNYGSKTYEIEAAVADEFQNALEDDADDALDDCLMRAQLKASALVRG